MPQAAPRSLAWSRLGRVFTASAIVGILATLLDWALLVGLVWLGFSQRYAIFPACAAGLVVQFFGNRHYAFQVRGRLAQKLLRRQIFRFVIVEIATLLLNALIYNLLREMAGIDYRLSRVIAGFGVYCAFSLPMWAWVFSIKR